ncbi:MAG: Trm112 family protein [Candidatus Wallbacteria bacterium]|nr:Trm112 family protein [Candidatus Wallbacteria bacterium]
MLDELLEILACPVCKKEIIYDAENNFIICELCRKKYPVKNEIPIMLADEAMDF